MPEILPVNWLPDGRLPASSSAAVQRAAEILTRGGLVAIPTETVYGLAALATDAAAVARIFRAKGRPATNPLIVHVADAAMASPLVRVWPQRATTVAAAHWPGPLTLVLPATKLVPEIVRAGGGTVAVRCPQHPVTAALLRLLGQPLAAPSGNRSGMLSPTTAAHVAASLGDAVDLILDGGTCDCGIESTVVDLTTEPPQLLRPGPIDRSTLAASLGCQLLGGSAVDQAASSSGVHRSPGLLLKHYAPEADLEVSSESTARVKQRLKHGERVGWVTLGGHSSSELLQEVGEGMLHHRDLPDEPAGYARQLYACLHDLDRLAVTAIVVETPPRSELWQAVHDRLTRAAHRDAI